MKVAVWRPQPPAEPEPDETDSEAQALAVAEALAGRGDEATLLAFDLDDLVASVAALRREAPDVVFNLVEETGGRLAMNILPAQILETLELPFTGSGSVAVGLTMHKLATKALLAEADLPTPGWISAAGERVDGSDGPYLLKPVCGDASQGIDEESLALAAGAAEARSALRRSGDGAPGGWFAERYVDGREFNLSVREHDGRPEVLPAAEMLFVDYPPDKPRVVGYRAKWKPDSFEFRSTVRRYDLPPEDAALVRRLEDLSLACWRLLRLRGYARVDFRVDREGRPWILEVNPNPCILPDAGFAVAAREAGISYPDLVGGLAAAALESRAHASSAGRSERDP